MDGANCHNYDIIGLYHITFFYKNEKERCKSKDNLMIYLLIKYIFLSIKIYIYKKGAYSTIERCDCMGLWSHVTIQKKKAHFPVHCPCLVFISLELLYSNHGDRG